MCFRSNIDLIFIPQKVKIQGLAIIVKLGRGTPYLQNTGRISGSAFGCCYWIQNIDRFGIGFIMQLIEI